MQKQINWQLLTQPVVLVISGIDSKDDTEYQIRTELKL